MNSDFSMHVDELIKSRGKQRPRRALGAPHSSFLGCSRLHRVQAEKTSSHSLLKPPCLMLSLALDEALGWSHSFAIDSYRTKNPVQPTKNVTLDLF